MADCRRPIQKQLQQIRSPFYLLPQRIRALAPHQALYWWEYDHTERHDFLAVREDMINNTKYALDGKFNPIDTRR
jgi:hypothetical protein